MNTVKDFHICHITCFRYCETYGYATLQRVFVLIKLLFEILVDPGRKSISVTSLE